MIVRDITPNHIEIEYKGKIISTNTIIHSIVNGPMLYKDNTIETYEDKYSGIRTTRLDDELDAERIKDILLFTNTDIENHMSDVEKAIIYVKYSKIRYILSHNGFCTDEPLLQTINIIQNHYDNKHSSLNSVNYKSILYIRADRFTGKNMLTQLIDYVANTTLVLLLWYWLPYNMFYINVIKEVIDTAQDKYVDEEILYYVLQHKNADSIYNKYLAPTGGVYG